MAIQKITYKMVSHSSRWVWRRAIIVDLSNPKMVDCNSLKVRYAFEQEFGQTMLCSDLLPSHYMTQEIGFGRTQWCRILKVRLLYNEYYYYSDVYHVGDSLDQHLLIQPSFYEPSFRYLLAFSLISPERLKDQNLQSFCQLLFLDQPSYSFSSHPMNNLNLPLPFALFQHLTFIPSEEA